MTPPRFRGGVIRLTQREAGQVHDAKDSHKSRIHESSSARLSRYGK